MRVASGAPSFLVNRQAFDRGFISHYERRSPGKSRLQDLLVRSEAFGFFDRCEVFRKRGELHADRNLTGYQPKAAEVAGFERRRAVDLGKVELGGNQRCFGPGSRRIE